MYIAFFLFWVFKKDSVYPIPSKKLAQYMADAVDAVDAKYPTPKKPVFIGEIHVAVPYDIQRRPQAGSHTQVFGWTFDGPDMVVNEHDTEGLYLLEMWQKYVAPKGATRPMRIKVDLHPGILTRLYKFWAWLPCMLWYNTGELRIEIYHVMGPGERKRIVSCTIPYNLTKSLGPAFENYVADSRVWAPAKTGVLSLLDTRQVMNEPWHYVHTRPFLSHKDCALERKRKTEDKLHQTVLPRIWQKATDAPVLCRMEIGKVLNHYNHPMTFFVDRIYCLRTLEILVPFGLLASFAQPSEAS